MPPEIFYYLVSAGVLLSATGLVVQAIAGYKLYRTVAALREKIEPLIPEAQSAIASATKTIEESRAQIADVSRKSSEVLNSVMTQLEHFDQAREEATARIRAQAERVELVLDDSLSRIQDVVTSMHRGVMRPVREVSGVLAGLRAGLHTLRQGGRPSVAEATNDDGMFI